jgi:hypothetical protein
LASASSKHSSPPDATGAIIGRTCRGGAPFRTIGDAPFTVNRVRHIASTTRIAP